MIRNVVMIKLRPDTDPEWLAQWRQNMLALDCPGTLSYSIGPDLGFRDGNWSYAIVADFTDEAAYRHYDADEEHNRLRAEIAPHIESIARCQFEV